MKAVTLASQPSPCGLCDEWIAEGDPIILVDDDWCHAAHMDEYPVEQLDDYPRDAA